MKRVLFLVGYFLIWFCVGVLIQSVFQLIARIKGIETKPNFLYWSFVLALGMTFYMWSVI